MNVMTIGLPYLYWLDKYKEKIKRKLKFIK